MMRKHFVFLALSGLVFLGSCETGPAESPLSEKRFNDLIVPVGFNWETSRIVDFSIAVSAPANSSLASMISVYDGHPGSGGKIMTKGAATASMAFKAKIAVPNNVREVYVVCTAPDNTTAIKQVELNKATVSLTFADATIAKTATTSSNSGQLTCTSEITRSSDLRMSKGDVVCITASDITVDVKQFDDGVLQVIGDNVNLRSITMTGNARMIIKGKNIAFTSLDVKSSTATFENFGSITASSINNDGNFYNGGTISSQGAVNFTTTSKALNGASGVIYVGSTLTIDAVNKTTNNGKITVEQNFILKNLGSFENWCSLYVKNNYVGQGGVIDNYGYVRVDHQTGIQKDDRIQMHNEAMFKTDELLLNGTIVGNGSTSLFYTVASSKLAGGSISGAIKYYDPNGIEQQDSNTFSNGASTGANIYIPVSTCNPEGFGKPPVTPKDRDGDGCPDSSDEFPDDKERCYSSHYPAAGNGILVFEDLWPLTGDYDLNDLVVSYRYTVVTNGQNQVVDINGKYKLFATGGINNNGFGVEFPINRSQVTAMQGATLETGQEKAVAILFTNMHNEMEYWNVVPGAPKSLPKSYDVSFTIKDGPSLDEFELSSYNPFIWNTRRGSEVHLPGKPPTGLADISLFRTGDDATNPAVGTYYLTKNRFPWALDLPSDSFQYPIEAAEITSAYLNFARWVESGGTEFKDWYSNSSSGYRNTSYIYN